MQIMIYIAQNHKNMSYVNLKNQEKYLSAALSYQSHSYSGNSSSYLDESYRVSSVMQNYRDKLPSSTVDILIKHSKGLMKMCSITHKG